VAGIEIEIVDPRPPDQGHVAGRGRPEPAPVLGLFDIRSAGQMLFQPVDDACAACRIRAEVEAVQLGRAGYPKDVTKP
jgi:hypothetical protein